MGQSGTWGSLSNLPPSSRSLPLPIARHFRILVLSPVDRLGLPSNTGLHQLSISISCTQYTSSHKHSCRCQKDLCGLYSRILRIRQGSRPHIRWAHLDPVLIQAYSHAIPEIGELQRASNSTAIKISCQAGQHILPACTGTNVIGH